VELRGAADARLVTELPEQGIIVTLSNLLPEGFRAARGQFIAAVAADFLPHPGAQFQILQNKAHAQRLPGSGFMPHWPQPGLIPRHPDRGERFETAAFLGDRSNLPPELADPLFTARLWEKTGLRFEIRDNTRWHDYSDVDLVIAIRDFSSARHLHKPATKLYNVGWQESRSSADRIRLSPRKERRITITSSSVRPVISSIRSST